MSGALPLPFRDPADGLPAKVQAAEDQPPPTVPAKEPHIPAPTSALATDPLPTSSSPPMPPVTADSAGSST